MTADLPYAGTSGWSGTDTSEQRAREEDESGTTAARQTQTLVLIGQTREVGGTVANLRGWTGWHHGKASGLLSVLHKVGKLERLAETRDRCHVYVLPEFVNGRETQPHGRAETITIERQRYEVLVDKAERFDRIVHSASQRGY